ncbi:helix-turn-helix domain-containing protein [Streptomyces bicolor]|uniref:helix-turn-helix domain-containing protein n=1 Tax=Streptomyces bicolor TaxID=66874 RepID=UPI000569C7E4|nr:helix-turn-helix transcriptional regulator [Streptomyces bicolor]
MRSDIRPDWVDTRLRALGERIRLLREAQELTQQDLGRVTKLGSRRIDHIEHGAVDTTLDEFLLIAHVLDVPPADLAAD